MYAPGCKSTKTYAKGSLKVYKGSTLLESTTFDDYIGFGFINFENLNAGTYTIKFKPTWSSVDVREYTVGVYAAEKVAIKDESGQTNEEDTDVEHTPKP